MHVQYCLTTSFTAAEEFVTKITGRLFLMFLFMNRGLPIRCEVGISDRRRRPLGAVAPGVR